MAEEDTERDDAPVDPTAPVDPREPKWSGAAAVPAAGPKRRKWLDDESIYPPPPPPAEKREPTIEMSASEREAFENDLPVDPWADADPLPAYPHQVVAYPPTRPYEAPPAQPPPQAPPPVPVKAPVPLKAPVPVKTPKAPKPPKVKNLPAVGTPPPGWRPPPGYVAVPVRRRRKWPWFALLSLLCCCGCPAWFGWPIFQQAPGAVVYPQVVGDLRLRDDPASKATAEQLKVEARTNHLVAQETFAALFSDDQGKRATVFGATGVRLDLGGDVDKEINRLTSRYGLTGIETVDGTLRDEQRRCGVGRDDGTGVVVCSWADHGSVGTGVFTRLNIADSNARLSQLRDAIVTRTSAS